MLVEWKDSLSVGVAEIDLQHKEMFKTINRLFEACSKAGGKEEAEGMIQFLQDYIVNHFGLEERMMIKHNYPDYRSHKAEHSKFTDDFFELKQLFKVEGPSDNFLIQLNRRVVDWLINHIIGTDMAMGSFLRKNVEFNCNCNNP